MRKKSSLALAGRYIVMGIVAGVLIATLIMKPYASQGESLRVKDDSGKPSVVPKAGDFEKAQIIPVLFMGKAWERGCCTMNGKTWSYSMMFAAYHDEIESYNFRYVIYEPGSRYEELFDYCFENNLELYFDGTKIPNIPELASPGREFYQVTTVTVYPPYLGELEGRPGKGG